MTVYENKNPRVQYNGPVEINDELAITFPYAEKEDIVCQINDELLRYGIDYTILGQTLTIKTAAGEADTVTIYRTTPLDQQAEFPQNNRFNSAKLNESLDKICMQQQEQVEAINRCTKVPITFMNFDGAIPYPLPNRALKVNSDATGFTMSKYDPDDVMDVTERNKAEAIAARDEAIRQQQEATKQAGFAAEQVNLAAEQVTLASEQVTLASEQVTLAAEQVTLASEQVGLAAGQVTLASEQVGLATEQANKAEVSAGNAAASAVNASISENNARETEVRCNEILARLGTSIKVKGRVDTFEDLPLVDNLDGDTYLVGVEGLDGYPEYYWYQDHWEFLGTSGAGIWGTISGDLSHQHDLFAKLEAKQNVLTAGPGIDITDNVISNTQTSAEWGNIQGTLSNQEDLQAVLDNKQPVGDYASAADVEYLKNRTYTDGLQLDDTNNVRVLYDGETISMKPTFEDVLTPLVTKTGTEFYMQSWGAANPSGLDATRSIRLIWYPTAGKNAYFAFGGRYKTYLGFGIALDSGIVGQLKISKPSGITTTNYGDPEYWEIPEFTSNAVPIVIQADFDPVNKKWHLKCTVQIEGYPTYTKTVSLPVTCTSFVTEYKYTGTYNQQYSGIEVYYTSSIPVDKLYVPAATTSSAGIVKPDGETIIVTEDGTISAVAAETGDNIINDIELNNPYSLFDCKYSDHELNNISWLQSSGQWNDGNVYVDAYDKLLKVYNGVETVEGLSVKLSTEDYTDYDFVLNTADEIFRLPLRNGTEGMFGNLPVVGNGMTLGLTDGTNNAGLHAWTSDLTFLPSKNAYGTPVGTASPANTPSSQLDYGVTTDPTKSGLVTDLSSAVVPDGWKLYYYVGETVQNANLIDAGRIGEQLANKQDKCIHITDTYENGTSGYRIWSDGYCEQWGYSSSYVSNTSRTLSISLLKTYKDTNYNIQLTNSDGNNSYGIQGYIGVYSKGTSQFIGYANTVVNNSRTNQLSWKTSGYLAVG